MIRALIADDTGMIFLLIHDQDVDNLDINETYILLNGYCDFIDDHFYLIQGKRGEIIESDTAIDIVDVDKDMSKKKFQI